MLVSSYLYHFNELPYWSAFMVTITRLASQLYYYYKLINNYRTNVQFDPIFFRKVHFNPSLTFCLN